MVMKEDIGLILSTFGDTFECDVGKFLGILGTELVTLAGGTYELSSQAISIQIATTTLYDFDIGAGTILTYNSGNMTYNLTVNSFIDSLNGWTELFCDASSVDNV